MAGLWVMMALVALACGQRQEMSMQQEQSALHSLSCYLHRLDRSSGQGWLPARPNLRLTGGRGKVKQMSVGAKARRTKKKKQVRRKKRDDVRKKRTEEFSMKPVRVGGGLVHPTRLKGLTKEDFQETLQQKKQPLSQIRSRLKLKHQSKKVMAKEMGHYPRKANFMPKQERRKLRKLQALEALRQRKNSIAGQSKAKAQMLEEEEEEEDGEDGGGKDTDSDSEESGQGVNSDESMLEGGFERLEEESKYREMLVRRSLLSVEGKQARLQSFVTAEADYPHRNKSRYANISPERMAEAGFRYLPESPGSDQTVFEQTGELFKDWTAEDVPMLVSVGLLESMYRSRRYLTSTSEVAKQIEYAYRVLGNKEEAERWQTTALEEMEEKEQEMVTSQTAPSSQGITISEDVIKQALAEDEMDRVLKENAQTWKQRAQQLTQLPRKGQFEWEKYVAEEDKNIVPIVVQERTGEERKKRHTDPAESLLLETMKENISVAVEFRKDSVVLDNNSYPLPSTAMLKFDDVDVEGGRIEGVNFSHSGMRAVRSDVSAAPIIRWATNLLTGAEQSRRSSWAIRILRQQGKIVMGFLGRSLPSSYHLELNSAIDGFLLESSGKAVRTSESFLDTEKLRERPLNALELARLHRKPVTAECRRNSSVLVVREAPASSSSDRSSRDLSYGQDSLIVLSVDREREEGRIDLYKSMQLDLREGAEQFSTGRLQSVVSLLVPGVANDSAPFLVMEEYGDSVQLLTRKTFKKELLWMIDPLHSHGKRRRRRKWRLRRADPTEIYVERVKDARRQARMRGDGDGGGGGGGSDGDGDSDDDGDDGDGDNLTMVLPLNRQIADDAAVQEICKGSWPKGL
eukprot:763112-Hanusia_phi.AAC.3